MTVQSSPIFTRDKYAQAGEGLVSLFPQFKGKTMVIYSESEQTEILA